MLQFGNKDKKQEYDLSALNATDDMYVVRHYDNVALPSGKIIQDGNRFQVYDKETFARFNAQPVSKGGDQVQSPFNAIGLNVDVLHEPK